MLLAAYRGAALSLLEALDVIDGHSSGIDQGAPIILVGGGAQGMAWRRVIAELSGRAIAIPNDTELVARGAAAQAASMLSGVEPAAIARGWDTTAGSHFDPVERDDAALERMRSVLAAAASLNG